MKLNHINKKIDNRLEFIRIIAIILVILLHVTNRFLLKNIDANYFNSMLLIFINCITRISVPLFFMISGIVNIPKKYEKKKYFSRLIRLIVILVIWTLVYYVVGNYTFNDLIHSIFSYLKPHLWYMYALIGLHVATPFITIMVKNLDASEEKLFIMLWIFFSGIYYLLKVILGNFGVDTNVTHSIPLFNATYYLGYYIAGYLIYKNNSIIVNYNNKLMSIIMVLCFVINTMLTIFVSFKNNNYYQGFFGYSNVLIIFPSIITLIICLKKIENKELKIVKLVCPYIFGIYLSHILILDLLIRYIQISNVIIGCLVYTTITFIVSYILSFLIKKIPYINKYIC